MKPKLEKVDFEKVEVLKDYNINLIDLNKDDRVEIEIQNAIDLKKVKVAKTYIGIIDGVIGCQTWIKPCNSKYQIVPLFQVEDMVIEQI